MKLLLFLYFVTLADSIGDFEIQQLMSASQQRALEIERMTKEAAIRQNQMTGGGLSASPLVSSPSKLSPPIPPPIAPPPPSIEDDRTFLAKMGEQEQLLNQMNTLAAREAMARNNFLSLESTFLNAVRPLVSPFFAGSQQPIPGHFVPLQQIPKFNDETLKKVSVQSRPQLPQRTMDTIETSVDTINNNETSELGTF